MKSCEFFLSFLYRILKHTIIKKRAKKASLHSFLDLSFFSPHQQTPTNSNFTATIRYSPADDIVYKI